MCDCAMPACLYILSTTQTNLTKVGFLDSPTPGGSSPQSFNVRPLASSILLLAIAVAFERSFCLVAASEASVAPTASEARAPSHERSEGPPPLCASEASAPTTASEASAASHERSERPLFTSEASPLLTSEASAPIRRPRCLTEESERGWWLEATEF